MRHVHVQRLKHERDRKAKAAHHAIARANYERDARTREHEANAQRIFALLTQVQVRTRADVHVHACSVAGVSGTPGVVGWSCSMPGVHACSLPWMCGLAQALGAAAHTRPLALPPPTVDTVLKSWLLPADDGSASVASGESPARMRRRSGGGSATGVDME